MKPYLQDADALLTELGSNEQGLAPEEAAARLEKDGKNKLDEGKKTNIFVRFLKELANPMIIVLLVAAAVSAVTAALSNESFADVFIILFVVVLNAVLGVYQESKAEKAIEALQKITAATSKVIRNGKIEIVKSEELVVGDVIALEAGDSVPADSRILSSFSLKSEEAALTGESVPVGKIAETLDSQTGEVALGDRKNMVYMGSSVVYGRATAVVTGTGMNTEMGKIATALTQAKDESTPLQKKLNGLSKILSILVLVICVVMFVVDVVRGLPNVTTKSILGTFMIAVSLAVAAIPEGLAAVVTIVLSIGVTNMSKQKAVIRKLTAVETLGCTQIICSDKTGTLTQNKMTVVEKRTADENLLATAMSLCSDAHPNDEGVAEGEPTECALVDFATSLGLKKPELEKLFPRVSEAPFDSMRKMMSTFHKDGETDEIVQFTKGAPDVVLSRCTSALVDGTAVKMTDELRAQFLNQNKEMADSALRVLAAAKKVYDAVPEFQDPSEVENELCFLGLTGMIDPVRPEVKDAIVLCRNAGIRPVMITGDHKDTAVAIAKTLGIIQSADEALTGAELDKISAEDFVEKIEQYSVYARVQPEHKVRIVEAWKAKGKITAMTGDGVNDAPSIKAADIGVGMGITGTDVTKNVADMVLADDNFATIVGAVKEGRKIYDNIRKAIQFLLASNLSEVISIFIATMMGFVLLEPVHLLWINLLTDTFPALALGVEKGEPDLMDRPPRDAKESLFSGGMGVEIFLHGVFIAALTLVAFFVGHYIESGVWEITHSADGTTMAFLTLSMAEIFHGFNMRFRRKSVFQVKRQNWFMWGAAAISLILTTMVIYVPFLADAFDFTAINAAEYFTAMALAFCIVPLVEVSKMILRAIDKAKAKAKKKL